MLEHDCTNVKCNPSVFGIEQNINFPERFAEKDWPDQKIFWLWITELGLFRKETFYWVDGELVTKLFVLWYRHLQNYATKIFKTTKHKAPSPVPWRIKYNWKKENRENILQAGINKQWLQYDQTCPRCSTRDKVWILVGWNNFF